MNIVLLQYIYMDLLSLINIFKHKHLKDGILLNCQKPTISIEIQKMFTDNYIKVNLIETGESNLKINYSPSRLGFIVNTSCDGWVKAVRDMNLREQFRDPFVWIFLTKDIESTADDLSRFPIEIDSDVSLIYKNDLYDVYNTGSKKDGKFIVEFNEKINEPVSIRRRDNRRDLTGIQLRCAIVALDGDNNITANEYLKRVKMQAQVLDSLHRVKYLTILEYLQDMYNITYKFQLTNSWGFRHNGSFDGMVGILERNEADVGGSPIIFKSDRNDVLDYAAQVWPTRHSFIFRHPKYESYIFSIYARPLSLNVWYCVLAMFILSVVAIHLMFKLKSYLAGMRKDDTSLSLAILLIWSALCQQGMSIKHKSTSINILFVVILMYTVLLYNYYNGIVVSILLMDVSKSINTLNDLLNSDLRAGDEEALYDREYFEHTTDPVAVELYNKKIKIDGKENFFTPKEGMALVKRGGFAFHVDTVVSYGIIRRSFTESEICEIQEVTMYPPERLGVAVNKNSPYKNHFAYGIRKMMEAGLLQRIRWNFDEPKPKCMNLPDDIFISVSIKEFSLPIIVFTAGVFASLIVLLFEILLRRMDNIKLKRLNL